MMPSLFLSHGAPDIILAQDESNTALRNLSGLVPVPRLVTDWQDVVEYEPDPVVYFEQHNIPSTEMPPDLTLYRRHRSGQIVTQKLAVPERRHYGFHRNIADHLLGGEPVVAPLADSVQVVAILEAAARSAARGGSLEVLDG